MFNSVEAVDEIELRRGEGIRLEDLEDEELKKYFVPSNFCLISSDGHTYGPFGTDSLGRKPVTIQIGNGDVLAQATSSFIYCGGFRTFKNGGCNIDSLTFKNDECFSFYVSNEP